MNVQNDTLKALAQADQYTQWIMKALSAWLPASPGRVLEVGCGIGSYSVELFRHASQLIAIDIEPMYLAVAEENLSHAHKTISPPAAPSFETHCVDLFQEDLTQCAFLEQPFESIVMLNVLEHLPDDAASLRRLRTWLAPETGRLLLWVPALPFLMSPYDRSIGHYRRYTRKNLETVLAQNGFQVEHCRYHNLAGIFGWWLQFCLLKQTRFNPQSVGLFNRLAPWLFKLEQAFPPPTGLSLLAVARRA